MLVLSRKPGESIVIDGGRVKVHVIDATAARIRLGIEAPSSVPVYRTEVFERMAAERERESVQLGELPGNPGRSDTEKLPTSAPSRVSDFFG
jgi:carbon storage regulator